MLRFIIFLLFGLLALLLETAYAQTDSWEVTLYDGEQILIVVAEGTAETISLPEAAKHLSVVADRYVALSPDRQYFAFSQATFETAGGFTSTLSIANLPTGDCCVTVDSPFTQAGTYIQVGPFSPDSAQLFVAATRWLEDQEIYESAFLIIDAASGAIIHQAEPQSLWNSADYNTTLLPEWTDAGMILYPACIPCEGSFTGTAWRWNPDTGVMETLDHYYINAGDRLALTGEYIYAAHNPAYIAPEGNVPSLTNVVEYRPDGTASIEPQVIYHELGQFIPRPVWVLDGAAYALHVPGSNVLTLVQRSGETITADLDNGQMMMAGTPDGWLMYDEADAAVHHYTLQADGAIIGTHVGDVLSVPQVLSRPALGASVTDAPLVPAVAE
jgi:hypothetical protein